MRRGYVFFATEPVFYPTANVYIRLQTFNQWLDLGGWRFFAAEKPINLQSWKYQNTSKASRQKNSTQRNEEKSSNKNTYICWTNCKINTGKRLSLMNSCKRMFTLLCEKARKKPAIALLSIGSQHTRSSIWKQSSVMQFLWMESPFIPLQNHLENKKNSTMSIWQHCIIHSIHLNLIISISMSNW